MKRWIVFLFSGPLAFGGIVPNQYIVELSTEPVAEHAVRMRARGETPRAAMRRPEVEQHRVRIRSEQSATRARVEEKSGEVVGQVENVANALIVNIPDAQAATLTSLPG